MRIHLAAKCSQLHLCQLLIDICQFCFLVSQMLLCFYGLYLACNQGGNGAERLQVLAGKKVFLKMFTVYHSKQFFIVFNGYTNFTESHFIVYNVAVIFAGIWYYKRITSLCNCTYNTTARRYFKAVVS